MISALTNLYACEQFCEQANRFEFALRDEDASLFRRDLHLHLLLLQLALLLLPVAERMSRLVCY